jgi:hypothetical protein
MPRPNPPWSVAALTDKWPLISSRVLPRYMPIIQEGSRTLKRAIEYGCGHYGCVMPTNAPGVVIKLSSDPTEIRFISAALGIYHKEEKKKYWPEGLTQYLDAYFLDGITYRGRKVAVIWRKSADNIGRGFPNDRDGQEAEENMKQLLFIARELRETIKDFSYDKKQVCFDAAENNEYYESLGRIRNIVALEKTNAKYPLKLAVKDKTRRAKILFRGYWNMIEVLASSNYTLEIGVALEYYFEKRIILADVHLNNIGKFIAATYSDTPIYGITDPGHALFFTDKFDKYSLEVL